MIFGMHPNNCVVSIVAQNKSTYLKNMSKMYEITGALAIPCTTNTNYADFLVMHMKRTILHVTEHLCVRIKIILISTFVS